MKTIEIIEDFDTCEKGELVKAFGEERFYSGGELIQTCSCGYGPNAFLFPTLVKIEEDRTIEKIVVYDLKPPQKGKINGMAISESITPEDQIYRYYMNIINRGTTQ